MKFEERDYLVSEMLTPAMKINDQKVADEYLEALIQWSMEFHGHSREEADRIQRGSLAYVAGYYDHDTRLRVEKLFNCTHPVFGAASDGAPSPTEAFEMGARMAKEK